MNDFSKEEVEIIHNSINRFLKQFENIVTEEDFWEETFNISKLKTIREKLKLILEKYA
jgi:flagellin-specific chaperone FliS